jgi:signal transduction histidine kinase
MVRSMLQRYAPTIDMKQLQVEVDLPEHLVQDCQKEGFNAIIKNLLENAVKFAEQGGFIRIELAAENAGAVLAVSNSYRQLSEKEISLLFQPFSRGVGEDVPGTGLGLALVERIAVDHGGGVVVENIEDGVRFAVRLPRPRKDESAS